MKVVYIAHPLTAVPASEMGVNRHFARQWMAWAWRQGVVPVAPWIPLTEAVPETPETRRMGMQSNDAVIARCDELWLCGRRISGGMDEEARMAMRHGVPVVDYTGSELPPEGE